MTTQTLLRRTPNAIGLIATAEALAEQLIQPGFRPDNQFRDASWQLVEGLTAEIAEQAGRHTIECRGVPASYHINRSGLLEREGTSLSLYGPHIYYSGTRYSWVLDRSWWSHDRPMGKTGLMRPLYELPFLFEARPLNC